jgi:hypothetical protein
MEAQKAELKAAREQQPVQQLTMEDLDRRVRELGEREAMLRASVAEKESLLSKVADIERKERDLAQRENELMAEKEQVYAMKISKERELKDTMRRISELAEERAHLEKEVELRRTEAGLGLSATPGAQMEKELAVKIAEFEEKKRAMESKLRDVDEREKIVVAKERAFGDALGAGASSPSPDATAAIEAAKLKVQLEERDRRLMEIESKLLTAEAAAKEAKSAADAAAKPGPGWMAPEDSKKLVEEARTRLKKIKELEAQVDGLQAALSAALETDDSGPAGPSGEDSAREVPAGSLAKDGAGAKAAPAPGQLPPPGVAYGAPPSARAQAAHPTPSPAPTPGAPPTPPTKGGTGLGKLLKRPGKEKPAAAPPHAGPGPHPSQPPAGQQPPPPSAPPGPPVSAPPGASTGTPSAQGPHGGPPPGYGPGYGGPPRGPPAGYGRPPGPPPKQGLFGKKVQFFPCPACQQQAIPEGHRECTVCGYRF